MREEEGGRKGGRASGERREAIFDQEYWDGLDEVGEK